MSSQTLSPMTNFAFERLQALSARAALIMLACAATLALMALAIPWGAAAESAAVSSNWSGYAVTSAFQGVHFSRVAGSWIEPHGRCTSGQETYSVAWVGLGGFNRGSHALEQAGTAVDCSRSGRALYSAWYELVPANPVTLNMTVHPGDAISASVAEKQGQTILQIRDLTSHVVRTAVRSASPLDLSSAEWIVEAPSICVSSERCNPLPLTDFGTISFSDASVSTTTTARAAIDARSLDVTQLELRDYANGKPGPQTPVTPATSVASALSATGNAFTVTWRPLAGEGAQEAPPHGLTSAAASIRR
jgi:hypothetical protein